MTNLSIPASRAPRMTCSSSGLPCNCTSGLGSSPERAASRLPLPAARISASLVIDVLDLGRRRARGPMRRIRKRGIIEIANADIGGAEDPRVGDAGGRFRKPESSALVVLLDEVNTPRPERWVFCRHTLHPRDCKILCIDPYASAKQILIGALGNSFYNIGGPALRVLRSDQAKLVVRRNHACLGAGVGLRGFRFRVQHLAQHMLVGRLPSVFGNDLKVLCSVHIAHNTRHHLGTLIHAVVVKNIFPFPAVATAQILPLAVSFEYPGHNFVGAERAYSRSLGK